MKRLARFREFGEYDEVPDYRNGRNKIIEVPDEYDYENATKHSYPPQVLNEEYILNRGGMVICGNCLAMLQSEGYNISFAKIKNYKSLPGYNGYNHTFICDLCNGDCDADDAFAVFIHE